MNHLWSSLVGASATLLPATRTSRLLTLIYHRVRPQPDLMFAGEVTAAQFEWQMRLLRRHCQPLPLATAVEALRRGELPPRAVAVTFDDGYRDNATVALPILLRHQIPATFFVATSFLGGGIMWNDRVIEAIRRAKADSIRFPELEVGDSPLVTGAQRGALAGALITRIKHLGVPQRASWVDRIVDHCGAVLPNDLMMSAAEVQCLHQAGMEIGAHTRTHPILMKLDAAEAREEIDGSRNELEQLTGGRVTAFAYPNGRPGEDYGPRERELVAGLGFQYAAATRWGVAHATTDQYQLPRFTPWDRDPARWLTRLFLQFRNAV